MLLHTAAIEPSPSQTTACAWSPCTGILDVGGEVLRLEQPARLLPAPERGDVSGELRVGKAEKAGVARQPHVDRGAEELLAHRPARVRASRGA